MGSKGVGGQRLWKMSALREEKEAVMHTVGGKSIAGKGGKVREAPRLGVFRG